MTHEKRIDLFLAGDSVTQGYGIPGILEFLRERIPLQMWNLSIGGYGPSQKVDALLSYALPKNPRWLIVEFYSGNDVSDAIQTDVCHGDNFRCYFNLVELSRRIRAHPIYGAMFSEEKDRIQPFDYLAENDFTVAVTRYFGNATRKAIRSLMKTSSVAKASPQPMTSDKRSGVLDLDNVSRPATSHFDIPRGNLLDWTKAGMKLTHRDYELLVRGLGESKSKPGVILLYNPSAYEIYRDVFYSRVPEYDEVAEFQVESQRSFAERNGWRFVDLTTPLRMEVLKSKTWIYGQFDGTHWSYAGTELVANVLATELAKVIALGTRGRRPEDEAMRKHIAPQTRISEAS